MGDTNNFVNREKDIIFIPHTALISSLLRSLEMCTDRINLIIDNIHL